MQRISAISPVPRQPGRVSVKVDGRRVATLGERFVAQLGLTVDQAWTAQLAARVARAAAVDKACRDGLSRLNRQPMSVRRLRDKLRLRGYDSEVLDAAVADLVGRGALDDEAFGRALVREMVARKPAGPRYLQAKLMQRGLEAALARRLVAEAAPSGDEAVRQAIELVERRRRAMTRLDPATQKRRLWGMLARRGFDGDVIERALKGMSDV
jgi:regulatory protein